MNLRKDLIQVEKISDMIIKKEYIPVNKNIHCNKCPIQISCCEVCTEVVYTTNKSNIDIIFIGQGAGKTEDISMNPENTNRQPFIGRAGKYLRDIIAYIHEKKHVKFNFALTNSVRFHPKNSKGKDRDPETYEMDRCSQILYKDLKKLSINNNTAQLISLGLTNSKWLYGYFNNLATMKNIRGINRPCKSINAFMIPTYHPSFLVRQYGKLDPKNIREYDQFVIDDIISAVSTQKNKEVELPF